MTAARVTVFTRTGCGLCVTAEADVACVVKGQDDGSWVVSLRSRGATDLTRVAMALGGGGHRAAAGYSSSLDLEGTLEQLRAQLRAARSS